MADDPAQSEVERLVQASRTALTDARRRFGDSVWEGDLDGIRQAFQGRDGYLLGLSNAHGDLEYTVLQAVLRDTQKRPLKVLRVFFEELGIGRYITDPAHNVCVFSLVISIDANRRPVLINKQEVAQHSDHVANIVRFMVEALRMPVPRTRPFTLPAIRGETAPLLELARNAGAWAAYAALAPYVAGADETDLLVTSSDTLVTPPNFSRYNAYWLARLLPKATDEQLLDAIRARGPEPRLVAERDRREQMHIHMRALWMLPKDDAPGRAVQQDRFLSQMIQSMAHKSSLT